GPLPYRQTGIDLVIDLIMVRRTRQEAGPSFHPKWRASSRRNDAASITRPMACKLPRSASLVGTAGFTSTQTVGTDAGNKLPVATACNVEATSRASSTPGRAARIAACAWTESVITPGNGPSARIVPAITIFTPRRPGDAGPPAGGTPACDARCRR